MKAMRVSSLVGLTIGINLVNAGVLQVSSAESSNANHIFNVIHSSMRQWGSSLGHNGVSFFLASVPEGTQFYHGNPYSDIVNGTEWVAFEPEHAMMFARPPGQPGPPRQPHGEPPQRILEQGQDMDQHGWLHTYAARRRLNLLYIDGMSAAKTAIGTLDSQDRVLLNDSLGSGDTFGEYSRAQALCNISTSQWGNRIDGFLRMEMGFEIITCSFKDTLHRVRVSQVATRHPGPPPHGGPPTFDPKSGLSKNVLTTNNLYKAITSRYNGIGGRRVTVYYDSFVTVFSHLTNLYTQTEGMPRTLPRLMQFSQSQLQPIRDEVDELVVKHDPSTTGTDWQSVADMIVHRYSSLLALVTADKFATLPDLRAELDDLLAPFVDLNHRDANLEVERCETQFIPTILYSNTTAYRAIRAVSHRICSTLSAASNATSYHAAIKGLVNLKSYLGWSTWNRCRGCGDDEYCRIPIWPAGSLEDFENPRCVSFDDSSSMRGDYWGHHRPRD